MHVRVKFLLASLTFFQASGWAGTITIPHTFTANTPAVASEVNENFGAVAVGANGNASDIAALAARIDALESTVASQQSTIASLTSQLNAIANNSALELGGYVNVQPVHDPQSGAYYQTAIFHGVNLQLVNGAGSTDTSNGLGNLTIGYNEADPTAPEFCADGIHINQSTCVGANSTWARNQRSGSHMLVIGKSNSFTQFGGLVVGQSNSTSGPFASVSAGYRNLASGDSASVSGGDSNFARGDYSSVSAGNANSAEGLDSSVSGGRSNRAIGNWSTVSGGYLGITPGADDWLAGSLFQAD